MKVAVIGLGTMGGPMALNLLAAGMNVAVHNRTREREEAAANAGAQRGGTPAEAAKGADVVLTCVSDGPDAEAVILGPGGVAETLLAGSLVVDTSTIAPSTARRLQEQLSVRGIGFVDAPVSGGSEGAVKGTLAVMCGGTDDDFSKALPVLDIIGGKVTHVGGPGAGQVAKAVNQVLIAGTYQALGEGLTLAARMGVDPRRVVPAIDSGAAASWVLDNRASNVIDDDYPLGFRVRLHRKDLRIALEAAEEAGVEMPSARHVAAVEDRLIEDGHGDEDVSAVARRVRRDAGLPDGPMPRDDA